VFPIRDDNPSLRFPYVVIALILINAAAFIYELRFSGDALEAFIERVSLVPARDFVFATSDVSVFSWFRPYLNSMFLHGGIGHILLNMWSLWIFGDNIEGRLGHGKFVIFYLLCGFGAALTHCYFNPESTVPVVGASGAISGVMGAYLVLYPRARIHMFTLLIFYPIFFELPAVVFLVLWFIGQLVSNAGALMQAEVAGDVGGIAFAAHIGGFIAGIGLLPFFKGPHPGRRRR
jgi:membrane associated rhomboid family serine protease